MKILFVLQCSWGADIGIAKVHYDLKPEFEKRGHTVDVLSYDSFYSNIKEKKPKLLSPKIDKLIFKRLKVIAKNYDVIDANYECIPYSKKLFDFSGLLIFRSHGIQPVYRKVEKSNEYINMCNKVPIKPVKFKTKIGNIYRYFQRKSNLKKSISSIMNADLVHCLNEMEVQYVESLGISTDSIVLISNGISDKYIDSAYLDDEHLRNKIIFLASWTPRKGIHDFNDIFSKIENFKLTVIGTFFDEVYVKKDLNKFLFKDLTVVQHFNQEQLPSLLKDGKVGIFPSYIEGFGLAVVEQLAAGIPVVAYDIPGPRDILKGLHELLLVPVGDTSAMSDNISSILSMDEIEYNDLRKRCITRAQEYRVSIIANHFLTEYKKGLDRLNSISNPQNVLFNGSNK